MKQEKKLDKGEILAIFGLLILNGRGTIKKLADLLKLSTRYIRNLTVILRKRKIITSLGASEVRSGIVFGSPVLDSTVSEMEIGPKEKVHILTMDLPQLLEEYPEILKWTETTLNIDSKEKLEEHLKRVRKELKKK